MFDILHSFFAGITFAVGVTVGALLCRIATEKGRKELADQLREDRGKIEERLYASLMCHERMAGSMEIVAKNFASRTTTEPDKKDA